MRTLVCVVLAVFEPVVRFVLMGLALLGLLTCGFFWLAGAPNFPVWKMLLMSMGCAAALAGYYAVCAVIAPRPGR